MSQDIAENTDAARQALSPENIANAVYEAVRECAITLRPDVLRAVDRALEAQGAGATPQTRSAHILSQMLDNAHIAERDGVPLCQDTGTVWVCLEVGEDLVVPADVFSQVDDAVARAYADGKLRMSIAADALLDRTNTADNTPAFCEVDIVGGSDATLHVMLKGGGSDNASRVVMLPPSAGEDGVLQVVLDCVHEKAANACPPLVIGVGVGGTFDTVARLAKHALLREAGSCAADERTADFEARVLDAVNATGIGPAALGGAPTALAVHVSSAPCHIAALPVAVNMGCCAMRSKSIALVEEDAR